jgi:hypothetical protein
MGLEDVGEDLALLCFEIRYPDSEMLGGENLVGEYLVGLVRLVLNLSMAGGHCLIERMDFSDSHGVVGLLVRCYCGKTMEKALPL